MQVTSAAPVVLAILVAVFGSGGILFGALRYNRDEAGKVIAQQAAVLESMRGLNDELQEALDRTQVSLDRAELEREQLRHEVRTLRKEVAVLSTALNKHER